MGNYFEILPEAYDEAIKIEQGGKPTDVVRLNAILEACREGREHGFKLEPGGALENIALNDGTERSLSVRILTYPETSVAGIVAVQRHEDGAESGRLLAVGSFRNGYQLSAIYQRGRTRLTAWVAKHGTLGKLDDES